MPKLDFKLKAKKDVLFSLFEIHSSKPTTQTTLMNFEVKHLKSQIISSKYIQKL
jgi:hypothetical protein